MKKQSPDDPERIELRRICREGRMEELLRWIDAGRPIRFQVGRYRKQVASLELVFASGFFDMAKAVLRACEWTKDEKDRALHKAADEKQWHLLHFWADEGLPFPCDFFERVCDSGDKDLMVKLVQSGVDPTRDDALADALCYAPIRPMVGFCMSAKDLGLPGIDEQIAIALNCLYRSRYHPGRTAFVRWACADPFIEAPSEIRPNFPGRQSLEAHEWEDDYPQTVAESAALYGDLKEFKGLKVDTKDPRIRAVLASAALSIQNGVFGYIIETTPAALLNESDRRSCLGIENLVSFVYREFSPVDTSALLRTLRLGLEAGCLWNPQEDSVGCLRRTFRSARAEDVAAVVRLLREFNQGTAFLDEVLRVPSMKCILNLVG
ncbi:MAG: hypothetical protein JJT96_19475 [Opitutales bacterium]|nr:hypothetical protein [Opitutales bacterium]